MCVSLTLTLTSALCLPPSLMLSLLLSLSVSLSLSLSCSPVLLLSLFRPVLIVFLYSSRTRTSDVFSYINFNTETPFVDHTFSIQIFRQNALSAERENKVLIFVERACVHL